MARSTRVLSPRCLSPPAAAFFTLPSSQRRRVAETLLWKANMKEFVSRWLEQHGAKVKTVVAIRKHAIDAECGVRQMPQLACNEPVIRNRRRRAFPFESAVPGFAEYLGSELGFAESTIRNYRRHLSEFAQYLSQIAKAHGVKSPQRDFV